MKAVQIALVLSLIANVVLVGMQLRERRSSGAEMPAGTAPSGGAFQGETKGFAVAGTWAALESSDVRVVADRLRAGGFPRDVTRAIILARVNAQFASREAALLKKQMAVPYWKTGRVGGIDGATLMSIRQLNREKTTLLTELLGGDPASSDPVAMAYQQQQFGNVPREKVAQLQAINSDYDDLRASIVTSVNGMMLPEDLAKMALLDREQKADVAKLLTPAELEDYELRTSSTASALRFRLGAFDPSEPEFRAIFRLQKNFDEQFGSSSGLSPAEQAQQRAAHQSELNAQIEATLGASRFADYREAMDPQLQMVSQLTARLELPASSAREVVAVQKDITSRYGAITSDSSMSADARQAAIATLRAEATERLTNALGGSRGFDAYQQYGGQWIQMLQSAPSLHASAGAPSAAKG